MTEQVIHLQLDGVTLTACPGETLWELARRNGVEIPHLCHSGEPGYRPDGNCRSCMVEIEGERNLAPACLRRAEAGMRVNSDSERARRARRLVVELLLADQPADGPADAGSRLCHWARELDLPGSRFPRRPTAPAPDRSHAAMAVRLDACIHCGLCQRACREVQLNDVIGLAARGAETRVVFDLDQALGDSTCVACGECVQACPTGALLPASVVDEAGVGRLDSERTVDTVCPYCGVGCQMRLGLRDGRITHVTGRDGPANQQRLCVKGRFGFDYVHHPARLTRPLIRLPGTPRDLPADRSRWRERFREADWDEALEAAAAPLRRIRHRQGPRALAGFGSAKCSNEEAYLFQKLVRTGFGSNNVDHCTRLCHASSVAALMEGIGSAAVTAPFTEALNARVIMVIGANPTENHPVAATYLKQAARDGASLVVMDPRGQALSRHATEMLQFRPGTDVALLNALLHVIVTESLYDADFVRQRTEDFETLRTHLTAYPPEKMAAVCGIDAATLRRVARLYAGAESAMIFWGMGVSQHSHGTDNARCLIALAMLCGQVGRPGTGLHPLRGQNNVQGASDAGLIPMVLPDYRRTDDPDAREILNRLWQTELDPEPGLTVVEIMDAIAAGSIRGLYVMGENPAMSDPDLNHTRAALASLQHLVVQDIFLTETAAYADVVLPAGAWLEKTGTVTNTNRQVQMGRQALEPPGQARADWWIIQEMARRLGLAWDYQGPEQIFAEMGLAMPSLANISWQRLEREGAVTYPCPAPDHPGRALVFGDTFPTASGRARLVPAHPSPPDERPDGDYPWILTTGRTLEHWHTGAMTRHSPTLDSLEPEAFVDVSPGDLGRLGLTPGDRVRVKTRRGEVTLMARRQPALPDGVLFIPFCFAEAAANLLTNPRLDPWGKIPEFKFCAARLTPVSTVPGACPERN